MVPSVDPHGRVLAHRGRFAKVLVGEGRERDAACVPPDVVERDLHQELVVVYRRDRERPVNVPLLSMERTFPEGVCSSTVPIQISFADEPDAASGEVNV